MTKYILQGKYAGEWRNLGSHDSWQSAQSGMARIAEYRTKFNLPALEIRALPY